MKLVDIFLNSIGTLGMDETFSNFEEADSVFLFLEGKTWLVLTFPDESYLINFPVKNHREVLIVSSRAELARFLLMQEVPLEHGGIFPPCIKDEILAALFSALAEIGNELPILPREEQK